MPKQPPNHPARPSIEQKIKTYRTGFLGWSDKKFARDAAKLAREGWRVQSQSASPGPLLAFGHPRSIVVVYVRQ